MHEISPNAECVTLQDRQLQACRKLMVDEPLIPVTVVSEFEPLEKTRLYGPFDLDTVAWVVKMRTQCPRFVTLGQDENGEYVQY